MSHHSLGGLHYVPAAAVVHVGPFLRLLTQIHHLIGTFAVKIAHESVCRSWPVTVGVAPMSVVTVVTLQVQQRAGVLMVCALMSFSPTIFFFFSNSQTKSEGWTWFELNQLKMR